MPLRQGPRYVSTRCVQCLKSGAVTEEHVFADGAGGYLTADILCNTCNGFFGRHIDTPYLRDPFVQVARLAHRLGGRRKNVPQPFEGPHTVRGPSGNTRIKFDIDFEPRVITRVNDIVVTEAGGLVLKAEFDASNREQIPTSVRAKFDRFFKSSEGTALGWTPEKQERAIVMAIDDFMAAPIIQTPTGELRGAHTTDMCTLFLEAAKSAFELAAIEDGDSFVDSAQAARIRELLGSVRDGRIEAIPEFESLLCAFGASPPQDAALIDLARLAGGTKDILHMAELSDRHVTVSMFGIAFRFRNLRSSAGHRAVYTNNIIDREVRYVRD